jgi:hypothetical protein
VELVKNLAFLFYRTSDPKEINKNHYKIYSSDGLLSDETVEVRADLKEKNKKS